MHAERWQRYVIRQGFHNEIRYIHTTKEVDQVFRKGRNFSSTLSMLCWGSNVRSLGSGGTAMSAPDAADDIDDDEIPRKARIARRSSLAF